MKTAIVATLACCSASIAHAGQHATEPAPTRATFDGAMLRIAHDGNADLSRFEFGQPVDPGVHELDVHRNGRNLGRHRVRFARNGSSIDGHASPCIDRALADALGLDLASLSRAARLALERAGSCVGLADLVTGARARYDASELALHTAIPQSVLVQHPDDAVGVALRESGIAAFRMNYGLTAQHHDDRSGGPDRAYASARIETGANAGRWRLRHRGTHVWRTGERVRSHPIATTLERDIDPFDAQLALGDLHTRGELFDALSLRGVRLTTDARMTPPSMQRYAPIVRGVAATNARVQVHQGEVLVLDTTVPAGPFALHDIRPLGHGAVLEVRVIEADGTTTRFAVPHAAVPGLLRRGQSRFAFAAGRRRDGPEGARVVEGTWQSGIGDRVTARVGTQWSRGYAQGLGGFAWSTLVGAFSVDGATSRFAHASGSDRGTRTRFAYAGHVAATRTTVDAAWRRGSEGDRSLDDALLRDNALRERARLDATLRQDVGALGALSLGFVDRRHAGPLDRRRSLQLGYGVSLGASGAMLQATLGQDRQAGVRTMESRVSLSVPLRIRGGTHAFNAHARSAGDANGWQAGAGGPLGRDHRYTYGAGVLQSTARGREAATTVSGTLGAQGSAGRALAGLSLSPRARQWSGSADGGLLWHARGVTFAPTLGDTVALLRAPHGAGAKVLHHPHLRLDRRGHAVVPHLSPYRRNRVGVDPRDADPDVHLAWTERNVVPRAGAVVDVALPTTHAPVRWLRIAHPGGRAVPFAAEVVDAAGHVVGNVVRGGITYVRAPVEVESVAVRWRDDAGDARCRIVLPRIEAARASGIADVLCDDGMHDDGMPDDGMDSAR